MFTVAGIAAFVALSCRAQGLGVSARVSTLGLGGEATLGLAPSLNLRVGYNWFSYDVDVLLDEADVTGELKLQTVPLLFDWHPFKGGFRFSLGTVLNQNEIKLTAKPNEKLELEGTEYEILRLDGKIEFDELSGYVGIGYGNAVSKDGRWHFVCDFGLLYHGQPKASATATAANPDLQALLDADLNKEVADFEDDISGIVVYPVIALGLSCRF